MTIHKNQSAVFLDSYTRALGSVFANLHSLEFLLRLFLYKKRSRPHASFRRGQNFTGLSTGTILPVNALTDYQSLGDLIKCYNTKIKRGFPALEIDQNIVTLRNALVHGRVFVPKTGLPLQLLKFAKPRNGKVEIKFAATLTPEWLVAQNDQIQKAIALVNASQKMTRRQSHV